MDETTRNYIQRSIQVMHKQASMIRSLYTELGRLEDEKKAVQQASLKKIAAQSSTDRTDQNDSLGILVDKDCNLNNLSAADKALYSRLQLI